MAKPVLVVGSVGLDTIETQETTVRDVVGGSSVYFAAAASLFAPVRLVSVAGDDFPDEARRRLEERAIDLAGLEVVEGGKTFRWGGRYSADMNERETLFTELNVLGEFRPRLPDAYRSTPYVFLANGPTATQHAVLDQMEAGAPSIDSGRPPGDSRRAGGFVAADTMNLWIETEREELDRLLGRIDLLVLNDEEARMLSGKAALWRAAEAISAMGPGTVVVKKGEHGACLAGRSGRCAVPAYPIDRLVDPTGAGDSFAGAFMGYLARADSTEPDVLRAALAVASVAASFTCESFGPDGLLAASAGQIESRLASLRELVRF